MGDAIPIWLRLWLVIAAALVAVFSAFKVSHDWRGGLPGLWHVVSRTLLAVPVALLWPIWLATLAVVVAKRLVSGEIW